jgi:SOS-response transcriptional repressor LexA
VSNYRHADPCGRCDAILRAIDAHGEEYGYAPSVREMGQAAGLASEQTTIYHLEALVARGLIVRDARVARSVRRVRNTHRERIA